MAANKPNTTVVIIAVSAVGIALYFNFVILPMARNVFETSAKVGQVQSELKDSEDDISGKDKFLRDIETYNTKVDSYEKMLPAEKEIPTLLEHLSEIAKSSNVLIVEIVPGAQTAKDKAKSQDQSYQEVPILINARSGYHELGKFIARLENSDRFMKVEDISIKANKSDPTKHNVEMNVLTYILARENREKKK
jgi:Tfp pilus assembly protein PilO